MTALDFHAFSEAFAVASNAFRAAGHPDLADFYLRTRDRITPEIAGLIRENAPPAAFEPAPEITPERAAAFLGRPVSKIRDDGGKVILAWIPGVGCRFVSRRKILNQN